MAISPDGRILAAGMRDGKVILWDLVKEILQGDLTHRSGPDSGVYHVVFSADGRYLATGNSPYSIKIWDMRTRKERAVLPTVIKGAQTHVSGVSLENCSRSRDTRRLCTRSLFPPTAPSSRRGPRRRYQVVAGPQVPEFARGHTALIFRWRRVICCRC